MAIAVTDRIRRGEGGVSPFAVAWQDDLKIAFITVADITARDAIYEWKRLPYMTVYVIATNTEYTLGTDLTIAGQVWTEKSYGVPSNVVTEDEIFDSEGYIQPQLIKNIFLNTSYVVADEAAMLALTTYTGNFVIRSDTSEVYIKLNNDNPADISDFALASGGSGVISVNGSTGVVSVTIASLLAVGANQTAFDAAVTISPTVAANVGAILTIQGDITTLQGDLADLDDYVQTHLGIQALSSIAQTPTGGDVGKSLIWNGTNYDLSLISGGGSGLADPMTTRGDLIFRNSSNVTARLSVGTATYVLTSDGTDVAWAAPSGGSGTVTSVGFTGGLISVATATTTPALTVAGTSGGIPYFSSSSTWASSGALAANALVIGGGAGVAPSTTTTGTGVLTFLGTPSWTNFNSAITGTAPFWGLSGTSTLTGNATIASAGYNLGIENFAEFKLTSDIDPGYPDYQSRFTVNNHSIKSEVFDASLSLFDNHINITENSVDIQYYNYLSSQESITMSASGTQLNSLLFNVIAETRFGALTTVQESDASAPSRLFKLRNSDATSFQGAALGFAINNTFYDNYGEIFYSQAGAYGGSNYGTFVFHDMGSLYSGFPNTTSDLIYGEIGINGFMFGNNTNGITIDAKTTTLTFTAPNISLVLGSDADQDLYKRNSAGNLTRIPLGSDNDVLTITSGSVGWAAASSGFTDPMTTAGDIIIRDGSNVTSRLAAGTNTHVLTLAGGVPTWAAPSGGGGGLTVGTSTITSGTNTKVLYNNSGVLGEYTVSGTGNVALTTSPTFTTPALGTPSALVGTNITGTATGLTSGITNALKSATTTVDVSAATAPTSGQVLTATSGTAATWQTPSGGGGITNGAANTELMMSNGTNAIASGLFATAASGSLTFGTGLTGALRTLTANGSATDVGFRFEAKGAGVFEIPSILSLGYSTLSGDRTLQAISSDTNSTIGIIPKGAGVIQLISDEVYLGNTAKAGATRTLLATGSATNVGMILSTKGTGLIQGNGQFAVVETASLGAALFVTHIGSGSISSPMNQFGVFANSSGLSVTQTRLSAGTGNFNITAATGHASTTTGASLVFTAGGGHTSGNTNAGHIYLMYGVKNGSGLDGNIGLLTNSVANWQSMERGVYLGNRLTAPTAGLANGVALFAEDSNSSSEFYVTAETGAKVNISGLFEPVTESGTSFTLNETHRNKVVICSNSGVVTVTVGSGKAAGWNCMLVATHATGTISLTTSGTTINGSTATTTQFETLSLVHYGSENYLSKLG